MCFVTFISSYCYINFITYFLVETFGMDSGEGVPFKCESPANMLQKKKQHSSGM
jgi:hypothetical protein